MSHATSGQLLSHIVAFGALLRDLGMTISPDQTLNLLNALDHVPITEREDFRATLRCTLVRRHEDLPLFEAAFAHYWGPLGAQAASDDEQSALPMLKPPPKQRRRGLPPSTATNEPTETTIEFQLTFSADERLQQKDFAQCSQEELAECRVLIQRMRWQIEERLQRRQRPARRGRSLDLRRTMHQSRRMGGLPIRLVMRQRRTAPRPLVVICDISGSMERYARILLQFVHTLSGGLGSVESFVFGTRLTRITRQLRHRDLDDALDAVSRQVVDWSGGTRIGEAIKQFNYVWGRRVLGRGPVVLLISDGWDRGDPDLLQHEIDRLQHSCHRLVWLNPLLGSPGYEPLTLGMQAALPYIDDFLPVHNLISLEQLGLHLNRLALRAPLRRRRPSVTL